MSMIVRNRINNRPVFYDSCYRRGLNVLFVVACELKKSDLIIEKFYVNKTEYDRFSAVLNNEEYFVNKSFNYKYYRESVDLSSFLELFNFNIESIYKNDDNLIDKINEKIKNYEIYYEGDQIKIIRSNSRALANEYFENRQYIMQKDSEYFPFNVSINIIRGDDVRFRLYNVGQANCSALIINNDPKIIFDLGKSRKCKAAIDMLSTKLYSDENNKKTIIISHYDNDHINMACYLPARGANLQFIMPDFINKSDVYKPNIQLLLTRAIDNGNNICLFLNDKLNKPLRLQGITLYQGASKKRDSNQSSNENSHSLLCCLNIRKKSVFIPGDALYNDIYTSVTNPICADYVIIPHHSCKYSTTINTSIIDLNSVKEAFVFCGPHFWYRHPNYSHFIQYYNSGAKLKRLASTHSWRNVVFCGRTSIEDSYFCLSQNDYYDWVL